MTQRSQNPMSTGSSVLGVCFDNGVVIAADTLASFGSLARFRDCKRVMKVNDATVLGAGGDYADYQFLENLIEQKMIDDDCADDGFIMRPNSLYCWLTRILYNRRSKFDPLWNTFVIGGLDQEEKPFLGYVDRLGTAFKSKHVASGFGALIALPMLREAMEKKPSMNEAEAKALLTSCLSVLFYRDARSYPKYYFAVVRQGEADADGVTAPNSSIEGPLHVQQDWSIAHNVVT